MTRQNHSLWGRLLPLIGLLVLAAPQHSAAAASTTLGISASPAQINLSLNKNDTQQTSLLTVSNSYNEPVDLVATFAGIDEKAGLLVPSQNLDPAFAADLHISETAIHIPARSSLTLFVQVVDSKSLAPGGHYATLVLTQQTTGGQLGLRASLSLSLFVVKTDGARTQLQAQNLSTNGWLFQMPTSANLLFTNAGNVAIVPRASIDVSGRRNRLQAHGIANLQSFPLLPDKNLTSNAPLTLLGHPWLPQKITVTATYRADGASDTHQLSQSMFYIPPVYPVVAAVAILYVVTKKLRNRTARPRLIQGIHKPVIIQPEPAQPVSHHISITVEQAEIVTPSPKKAAAKPKKIAITTSNRKSTVKPKKKSKATPKKRPAAKDK